MSEWVNVEMKRMTWCGCSGERIFNLLHSFDIQLLRVLSSFSEIVDFYLPVNGRTAFMSNFVL